MKNINLLPAAIWVIALLAQSSQAYEFVPANAIKKPYLEISVIDPPRPINWKSPKTLLRSTLINGLTLDYAPNGHLTVKIVTDKPNAYGVTSILTGMGRTDKMKTMWDTIYRQYGLSAMIHDFPGDLDSKEATEEELAKAKKANRVTTMRFQLTDQKANAMFEFLDLWIRYGSYRHYGGNKNVEAGEGSGCADFATLFAEIALDGKTPKALWDRSVYLPYTFLQKAPGRKSKKVSITKILADGNRWAKSEKEGLFFTVPDPERISDWIRKVSGGKNTINIMPSAWSTDKSRAESAPNTPSVLNFDSPYKRVSEPTVAAKWKSIRF